MDYPKLKASNCFFNLDELHNSIIEFMRITNKTQATLVGHSLGGWLALKIASKNPELIKHLVLINSAGIMYNGIEKLSEASQIETIKDTKRLLHTLWLNYPIYFEPFNLFIHRYLISKHINEFISRIKSDDFMNEELKSINTTVDVIWGENDILISKEVIDILRNHLPKANIHSIKNCGHVPQLEQSKALAKILDKIL